MIEDRNVPIGLGLGVALVPSIPGRTPELDSIGWARRRRQLQVLLGCLWLLDAGLQLQPFMFGQGFVTATLVGSQAGNPQIIKTPIVWAAQVVSHDPALFNTGFALIQLALALGILWRPTAKRALAASIVWSLAVWWLGEGAGGVFSGQTPLMGYPGAVLLYALVALIVWPTGRTPTVATTPGSLGGPLGDAAPKVLWLVLWASFVRCLLLPANRSPQGLHGVVAAMSSGEPRWVKSIDETLARALAHHGTQASIALAGLCAFVAFAVFVPRLRRAGLVLAALVAVAFWVAQDFGGIFTGRGTDPNTGPLLILLAATFWPLTTPRRRPERRERIDRIREPEYPTVDQKVA